MIKNSFKFIVLIILVIITSACSSNSNSFWGFKPHFSTGTYIHSYAIIENGKINRMGIPKKDIDKMKESINTMLDLKIARKMVYNMDLYFDFYLQIYVLIYAKIALYHGIDLEVDSDIAPKELIDNTPAKEYPEPYEFMKKFDLKTITAEEWKAWIYEYHPEPEKLKENEERGYIFV